MKIIVNNINYDLRPEGAFVLANDYQGDIIIPAQIIVDGQSIRVVGIAQEAFYGCDDVMSITLPEGLTTIEDSTFEFMSGLTEIVIPDSVTHIGRSAFSTCENLQRVVLPSHLTTIPEDLFESCSSLTEVNIPAGVKTLEPGCFSACTSLKTIQLPEGLESIGAMAFELCSELERVIIPETVTKIGGRAFNLCSNLRGISLPNSITHVGVDAFEHTKWLEKHPGGPVVVGRVLYKYKPMYEYDDEPNCTIIDEVERITNNAFSSIHRSMYVFLPKNLKELDIAAIMPAECIQEEYCTFVLPEGVGEDYPYHDTDCYCATIDGIYYMLHDTKLTATVVRSCNFVYRGRFVIPERVTYDGKDYLVTTIGYRAFAMDTDYIDYLDEYDKMDSLLEGATHVEIPSIILIEDEAFYMCHGLTTVVFRGNIAHIGENVFVNTNDDIQAIIVPTHLKNRYQKLLEKYDWLVTDCVAEVDGIYYSLDSDTHTAKVIHTAADDKSYDYYTGDIVIPAQITYQGQEYQVVEIAASAFRSCSISSITLPEGLVTIGNHAFEDCSNLRFVDMPDTVNNLRHGAFAGCSNLRYVKLSENVRLMRNDLFYECTQLQTVLLGSQIKNVGSDAFAECENLRTIYLPETVKKIGEGAFTGCRSLKEVRIPDSVHILDMSAFDGCYEMNSLILGPNISHLKGIDDVLSDWEATIFVPRHKIDDYCQKGLEPLREHIQAIETMEAESSEALWDWFINYQLNKND